MPSLACLVVIRTGEPAFALVGAGAADDEDPYAPPAETGVLEPLLLLPLLLLLLLLLALLLPHPAIIAAAMSAVAGRNVCARTRDPNRLRSCVDD